ncbi:MAG: PIN domain-containing protein [Caldilineaceae bacterium]
MHLSFTSVAFDSAPIIYYIEDHPKYAGRVQTYIDALRDNSLRAYASVITLTEVLSRPKQLRLPVLEQRYTTLLQKSRNFLLQPVTVQVALQAADLRARYNLRTPDAIHVATALTAGCEALLTNDRQLKRIEEITVLVLDDLIAQPGTESTDA